MAKGPTPHGTGSGGGQGGNGKPENPGSSYPMPPSQL